MNEDDVFEHKEAMGYVEEQSPHKVQVTISCRNLIDMDGIGNKSDPFAVLYIKAEKDVKWQRVGRTKTIPNCLNPDFQETFFVNYHFERNQLLRVEIFDEDDDSNDLIGNFDCFLNKLLTAHNQTIKGELIMGQARAGTRGKIYLTANSVSKSNNVAKMSIQCRIIDKKNKAKKGFLCFCKPPKDNPFLIIEKLGPQIGRQNNWIRVYETETQTDILNPLYKKVNINMFNLCGGNSATMLRFSLFSRIEGAEKHLLYGRCETSAKEIQKRPEVERELINERGKPKVAGTI